MMTRNHWLTIAARLSILVAALCALSYFTGAALAQGGPGDHRFGNPPPPGPPITRDHPRGGPSRPKPSVNYVLGQVPSICWGHSQPPYGCVTIEPIIVTHPPLSSVLPLGWHTWQTYPPNVTVYMDAGDTFDPGDEIRDWIDFPNPTHRGKR